MDTFYFKRTTNGNILGELSNNFESGIYTESSDLTSVNSDNLIGEYVSTWQASKTIAMNASLLIKYKTNTKNQLFKLTWKKEGE